MKKALISLFVLLFVSTLSAEKISYKPAGNWKFKIGSDVSWTQAGYNDSSWESVKLPGTYQLKGKKYSTFRTKVTIPSNLLKDTVYLDTGHAYGAFDVYVNGVLIGSNGRLPPNENIRPISNYVILVPSSLIADGEAEITFKCYTTADVISFSEGPVFMNREAAHRITFWRELLGARMYVIIAVICLIIGCYMISQYFTNKKNGSTFLWYALSAISISFYFYDMGSNELLLPFTFQREFFRAMLPVSLSFLLMFFRKFIEGKIPRRTIIFVIATDSVSVIGHLALMNNFNLVSTLFTILLAPVMYVCIFGIVVSIKGLRSKSKNLSIILVGFLLAVGLAFFDIIAQIQGKEPFVWLQGYAFFILNLAVFLTLLVDSIKNQKAIDRLVVQAHEQNVKLAEVFEQARKLSSNTTEIAGSLNQSVLRVTEVSSTSMEQVHGIEAAIVQQNTTLEAADSAVENLISSLSKTTVDLEKEAESLAVSADQTAQMLSGFQSVGRSISASALLAQSLDKLTVQNVQDVTQLTSAMDEIKTRSEEIMEIVQVLDHFANRTNLLAMNASIEAAHAGVAGKGFAVVANEIKNLAAQSSAQAAKINENVYEIVRSIETGVSLAAGVQKTLGEMRKEASETANHVKSAADEMNLRQSDGERIEHEQRTIAKTAQEMKVAAQEQFNYSDTVKNSMEQLRKATKAVDEAAGAIAEGSRLLSENVSELKAMSEKTTETSDKLTEMMAL